MRLNLSVVIVYHVSFFVYSNILEVQDLFPCHFTLGRDFNMIPRQKGDQRWENFNVHRKYMKKEKVLMFFYFFLLNFKSIFISQWMYYFLRAQGNFWENTLRTLNWFSQFCGGQGPENHTWLCSGEDHGAGSEGLRPSLCSGSSVVAAGI